jgi:hypothetical protein
MAQLEKQLKQAVREFVRNKIPVLRRIFVRILFVFRVRQWAHIVCSCVVATQNTDKKTSKMGCLFLRIPLTSKKR